MKNRAPERWGLLSVYTGDGKGKTTAALGVAIRAFAAGKKVGIVYFDKGGTHYGERAVLDCLARTTCGLGSIEYVATGLDRIDPETGRFRFGVTDEDRQEGRRGVEAAFGFLSSGYDLVVLDEFDTSSSLGIISEADARRAIDTKAEKTECICTGRDAPAWLVERADLVTEMRNLKHYFSKGVAAREGIDY